MRRPALPLLAAAWLAAGLAGPALAGDAGAGAMQTVYQQRLPDGRVVLSDRPAPGAVIERDWVFEPEDPAQAAARREAAEARHRATEERARQAAVERERLQHQLELERLRREQLALQMELERERLARPADPPPVIWVHGPHRPWLPGVRHLPRSPWEPALVPPAPPRPARLAP